MRLSFALLLLLLAPGAASAQLDAAQKKATADWVLTREDPKGGFRPSAADAKPGLRATSAAVRALKYLGAEVPEKEKHAAFVLGCFDPKTGGFAEPGGGPDVALTSVGVMAAVELGVPREKFSRAMDYLKGNAKTFEEVRIGAAAVEAWGVKDCPFDLKPWRAIASADFTGTHIVPEDGGARTLGSYAAFVLRLDPDNPWQPDASAMERKLIKAGQLRDGGWGKKGEKASDLESTYRVMRALMLLKEHPRDAAKLREFVAAHRNKDGGYAAKPGEASAAGPTYYAVIISKWLGEMEKK